MRMMLVGAGAVGESILKVMQWRDPKGEWLKYVLVCDYDLKRAEEVVGMMKGDSRCEASKSDATNTEEMAELIREHKIDFVMDVAPPFASNMIFDAAFKTGADYGSMGTWSVPMEDPAYGLGIENSYTEPMTKYNFDRHEAWKKQGNMAVICMGIDPGEVNVFAKFAATELLDEITEVHVKDGGNLSVPGADPDDIMFGFNVWTVLDEVMNPIVEYDKEKGGFIVEKAFAGQEVYEMPEGVGKNTLVKVEHEEVVTMARYLSQYGLKKATIPAATQLIEQPARIGTFNLIYAILSDGGSCFKPVYSIYGIVAGEASATVFSVITIKKDFSYFKISVKSLKTTAYGMAALFIPLSLNYILASFSSSVENVLIPRTLKLYGLSPALALDIFGTISGLTLPVLLFPGVLCSCACVMLLPSVSEANAAGKDTKITKTINSCALFGLCFGLIFTCIFYLLSDFIGDFLFSSKLCGYFLRRLCFLCPLMHISGMLCSILHGLGKAKQVLFVNLLTCAIRILMIMLLVPHYGIDAYLWAMLVSHVFMTLAVGILTCHTAHK